MEDPVVGTADEVVPDAVIESPATTEPNKSPLVVEEGLYEIIS